MKQEENIKKKGKRSISILTIFLWLALIVVMVVITINGMVNKNAIEGDNNILRIKIKVEGLNTDEIKERYENLNIRVVDSYRSSNIIEIIKFKFIEQDNEGNYVYELNREELLNKLNENNIKYSYGIMIQKENIDGYAQVITSNDFHDSYYRNSVECGYISINYDIDYNLSIKYVEESKVKLNINIDGIDDEEIKENIYNNIL